MTSCTRSSRATSATPTALLADLAGSARAKAGRQRRRSARRRWSGRPVGLAATPRPWPSASRRRPAVHVRQRRQLDRRRVRRRPVRRAAVRRRRCRRAAWSTTPPCSPRSATTSASTSCSPASSSPTPAPGDIALGMSTSGNSPEPADRLRRGAADRRAHGRARRLRRRRDGASDDVDHCLVVRSDSVHRIQETQAALVVRPVVGRAGARSTGWRSAMADGRAAPGGREAAVLDRIEAFRRRRPRLTDEVITLAHGAGGKASAALVDAVFLDAFAGADHGPLPDAATLVVTGRRPARLQHRLVRRRAAPVPGRLDRPPRRARHRQRPRRAGRPAGRGSRPRSCSRRASRSPSCGPIVADMAAAAAAAGVAHRDRRHQGRGHGAPPTACSSRRPASGVIPAGRTLGPEQVQPGDRRARVRARSATTAWR